MKSSTLVAVALVATSAACGDSGAGPGSASDASAMTPSTDSAPPPPDSAKVTGSPSEGGEPPLTDASGVRASSDGSNPATIAMARISGGVPAFSSDASSTPSSANDDDNTTSWSPKAVPAWIAYDLSKVSLAQRESILVVWNSPQAGSYINNSPPSGAFMPTDYTIETNAAPGGTSAPPTTGWVQVAAVSNNLRNTVEHPVNLAGGNWVRMSITASSDSTVSLDLDVFSTPIGDTDCWMLMGDSITYITFDYVFSNLPQLVHKAKSFRWPAVINAAIGGTGTPDAVASIASTMSGYPGRYVVLAYGTNDLPQSFEMESLVQTVLAAGKIPVIPLMPWSDAANIQTNGPIINAAIMALYAKYSEIVPGPDLWTAFMNRTDLIPSGDVHPNDAGEAFLRQQWATVMASIP